VLPAKGIVCLASPSFYITIPVLSPLYSDGISNLSGKAYTSLSDAQAAGAATINYGIFLNNIIDFIIIAFIIFILVRAANRIQDKITDKKDEPTTKECPYCLSNVPIKATKCAFCTSEIK
jgi:large conductance mechanosensitive channel